MNKIIATDSNIRELIKHIRPDRLDVSRVTNMRGLFERLKVRGDISGWDVSNVRDMSFMFLNAKFTDEFINLDLSKWDTSRVTTMNATFLSSNFNGNVSGWDVSNVRDMRNMFRYSPFDGDISNWDVSNVRDMSFMFGDSQFNGDISNWDVSNVTNMENMFYSSQFDGDISNWDVSNVISMSGMFDAAQFNGDLSKWDVSNVTDMSEMFQASQFNNDSISNWDVSNVESMCRMFFRCKFNRDISKWDVSNVKYDKYMFYQTRIPIENKPKGFNEAAFESKNILSKKQALYESVMKNVAKEVKKVLNEQYGDAYLRQYEPNISNDMFEEIKHASEEWFEKHAKKFSLKKLYNIAAREDASIVDEMLLLIDPNDGKNYRRIYDRLLDFLGDCADKEIASREDPAMPSDEDDYSMVKKWWEKNVKSLSQNQLEALSNYEDEDTIENIIDELEISNSNFGDVQDQIADYASDELFK